VTGPRARRLLTGVAIASTVVAAAGCGATTLDRSALEQEIAGELARQTGERPRVACPDGREAAADVVFRCTLTLSDGSRSRTRVTVLGEDGRFRFELEPAVGPDA
jgi:hypothetical protein